MSSPLRSIGLAAVLLLASAPARAGDLQPLGDTTLCPLGRDVAAATSGRAAPAVHHGSGPLRVGFDVADDGGGPPVLELAAEVAAGDGARGVFSLTFDGQTTSAAHFDGRFLGARDLTREQGYRLHAGWTFATGYTYSLYRGGVRVAVADADDGVAPFVLEGPGRVEAAFAVGARPRAGGGEQLELQSWSLGTWTATFDDGAALIVDRVEVAAHEVGHSLAVHHEHVGTTVAALGVAELRVGVEQLIVADGAALAGRVVDDRDGGASLELGTTGAGTRDVHGVLVPAASTARTTLIAAPTGYRVRLRSRRDGAPFAPWTAWSTAATLVTPASSAAEAIDDVELELQRAGAPTLPVSGYIRIKKLNSGG